MLNVLLQAMVYVSFIALGMFLRKIGFLWPYAFHDLSRIVVRITLPCALFYTFLNREIDTTMLVITALGFGLNALLLLAANFLHWRKSAEERAFSVLTIGSFNVGTFTLPFLQTFYGGMAVVTAGLFEVGNGFYSNGGSLIMAKLIKDKEGFSPLRIIKGLLHSAPFVANIAGICVAMLHIPIPWPVEEFVRIVGNANPFLSMFALGVSFHLDISREHIGKLVKILGLRYLICAVAAAVFWFFLPFEPLVRKALVIVCFAPLSTPIPAYAEELKLDAGLAGAIDFISVVISTVIIVALLTVMG